MRYLSIDLGDKRTGVAAGDSITRIVQPVEVVSVPRGPALLDALVKLIVEHAPDELVLGMPYNMDGTEGPRALATRAFAQTLAARSNLQVHLQDERLTSFAAEQRLNRSGRTHGQKKQLRDALAACTLLEDFLALPDQRPPTAE